MEGDRAMTAQAFEEMIAEGIKGLPPEALAEITDFVFFVRKRTFDPQMFEDDLRELSLRMARQQLNQEEEQHMEEEFKDYDKLYPPE
jgi:hypothetical protein